MAQHVLVGRQEKPSRGVRRAARLKVIQTTTIVTLRRATHREPESGREVDWTHRWLVRGHWRTYWSKPFVAKDRRLGVHQVTGSGPQLRCVRHPHFLGGGHRRRGPPPHASQTRQHRASKAGPGAGVSRSRTIPPSVDRGGEPPDRLATIGALPAVAGRAQGLTPIARLDATETPVFTACQVRKGPRLTNVLATSAARAGRTQCRVVVDAVHSGALGVAAQSAGRTRPAL